MNFFFNINVKYKNFFLYLSILITYSFFAFYHLSSGSIMSSDSYQYSEWADNLIKLNFNLNDYYAQDNYIVAHFFYTVPIVFVAIFKVLFGNEWQYAFLILNLVLLLFSLIIFVKSLIILEVRPIIISLTMPLIFISVDLLMWPRYILSDMIFAFLVILASYLVIKGIIKNKFNYFTLFLIIIFLLISRPSSLPIIFVIIFYILISKLQINNRPKTTLLFLLTLLVFTPLVFAMIFYFIKFYFNASTQLTYLMEMVNVGMIIHDRPETWVSPPNNFIDISYIYFLRLISFFNPYAASFSLTHLILNFIQTFLILLSLIIWSLNCIDIKSIDKTVFFILLLSFSVAAFHSFTVIDYDWRYRFPIILPLIMIFSLSVEIIFRRFSHNWIRN